MPIITLTSDLGLQDHYVASIKGKILSTCPEATFVDISHQVELQNIKQGAFVLKNSFYFFPDQTIHLIAIDSEKRKHLKCVIVKHKEHYFAGVDNGIFSLIFEDEPDQIFEISYQPEIVSLFLVRDVLCDAVAHLAMGKELSGLGNKIFSLERKMYLKPPEPPHFITGSIVYFDIHGNAITNITQEKFNSKNNQRSFVVHCKRSGIFSEIVKTYSDVKEGDILCLFNSNRVLEIAQNHGSARKLLGLQIDDTIQIEFL